jgi:hypothetical protein
MDANVGAGHVEMTCESRFEEGQILAAHELLQESIKAGTETTLDDVKLHQMIREEYKEIRHTQSRMQDKASWKRQYINKRACDSDDTVEIMMSSQTNTLRDFLVQASIEDAITEPFDILKHLDMCYYWIGCIVDSTEVYAETAHLKVIRISVANRIHRRLPPRYLFLKVLIFDNVNFDGAMGCTITHMNQKELESCLPRQVLSKYASSMKHEYDVTAGNFRRITFYFKDMQNRTVSGNKYSSTTDHLLKCTILVENMYPNALLPSVLSIPIVSNYLYSSCIWWTSHAKQMPHSSGPLLNIQTRVFIENLERDKLNTEKQAAAAKKLELEEDAQRQALAAHTNISVNLIDF